MLVPIDRPLNLPDTLESGQAFRWQRRGEWYCGVVYNNLVKLRQTPAGVEFSCAPASEAALEPLLRDYLRLDDDLEAIYRAICVDERVRDAVALYRGMRLLRQDPWECLISFICSANSNVPRISANVEAMSTAFGQPVTLDGQTRSTFPTPEALADAGEGKLRALGLGFRARYVAATARAIADGRLDLFGLREAPYEEALAALLALPGVGDKVANCVLLFSLDKLEAFPVDVWIERALREWYLGGEKLPRARMRPWAQAYFGPYAGYANQYLFHRRRLQGRAKHKG